jgi:hypothetical protein
LDDCVLNSLQRVIILKILFNKHALFHKINEKFTMLEYNNSFFLSSNG